MFENIISYVCFSAITLFTLFWGLTFVAQVKGDRMPRFNPIEKIINPVQKFEAKKKQVVDQEQLLNHG